MTDIRRQIGFRGPASELKSWWSEDGSLLPTIAYSTKSMIVRLSALLAALLCMFISIPSAIAQDASRCGEPPRVDDATIRGTIEGKAKFLSSLMGDAALSGNIQASRLDVFKQAPDGMKARADAYLQYQVCILLTTDRTLSTQEKIEQLIRVRTSFLTPLPTAKNADH